MVWLKVLTEKTDCALKLKGYSSLTINAYIGHTLRFFNYIKKKPDQVVNEDIEEYLLNILEKKRVSFSYVNQAVSAIKFVYKHVIKSKASGDLNANLFSRSKGKRSSKS